MRGVLRRKKIPFLRKAAPASFFFVSSVGAHRVTRDAYFIPYYPEKPRVSSHGRTDDDDEDERPHFYNATASFSSFVSLIR